MKSYNDDLYDRFNEIADLMSLLQENPFKIIAYRTAARRIKESFERITKKNASKEKFMEIPRIGTALAEKMMEYIRTKKIRYLEKLRKQIPKPVRDLLGIPHLGPKRVRELFINLGIKSKKDLVKAAKNGKMDGLPGFGPKLVEGILQGIKTGQKKKKRHSRSEVAPIGKKLTAILKRIKGATHVDIGGSYRRGSPTVGDLDILVVGPKNAARKAEKAVAKEFKNLTMLASGETKVAFVIFPQNLQVDIRFVPEESYGAALLYFTGSKEHNVIMRKRAIGLGYLLNEYGLFKQGEYVAGATEQEVFDKLGMKYVAPEKRK
ncbi:hypothetical protein JXA05_02835 [Candidatus Peregrinibacteria bacterium]|nr:hypothetical protein [Candidatus Peregrinibacteria bacterium]